jgi:hypothetical protein
LPVAYIEKYVHCTVANCDCVDHDIGIYFYGLHPKGTHVST